MTVYTEETTERRPISPLLITGAVVAVVVLLLVMLLLLGDRTRPLKPAHPSATPVELTQRSQASLVTFDELNANPYAFRNQRIRITGDYAPQPEPDCQNYRGPLILWALINDDLQMNGRGFESVVKLVPAGTSLTVEGIWRLFEGPVGCGKDAGQDAIWYLQVEQIVQPNPLPNFGPAAETNTPDPLATPTPAIATPVDGVATAVATPTRTNTFPTLTATATPGLLPTLSLSPTLTATPDSGISPTPVDGQATATPGDGSGPSPTWTATPSSGAATATPTPPTTAGTATATPPSITTSTPGPTPTPGPSPTSGGYPGPEPTDTPGSYPPS